MGSSALYDGPLLTDLSDDDLLTRTIPPDRRTPSPAAGTRTSISLRRNGIRQSNRRDPHEYASLHADEYDGNSLPYHRCADHRCRACFPDCDSPPPKQEDRDFQETAPRLRRTAAAVENIPRATERHNLHSKTRRGVRFSGHLSVFYVSAAIAAGPLKKRTIFLPPDGRHPAVYSTESAVGTAACSSTIAPGSSPLRCLARKRSIVR